MTDYIEKNSVIELIDDAIRNCKWHVAECTINTDDRDLKTLREKVKAIPAADVVEVVRCKDCRHKQVDEIIFALSANPETALFCKRMGGIISETFYCAAGERMDGDKS